jgi:hypothetical protein
VNKTISMGLISIALGTMVPGMSFAAKKIPDVGVIGPNGEVMLYYRDGDKIVIKQCAPNTVLGSTTADARSNCQGAENRVPVAAFKKTLRSLVSLDNAAKLKPLTSDQVKSLNSGTPPTEEQLEAMQKDLDKLNAFIAAYGPGNANIAQRDQLVKDLASNQLKSSAVKAANDQIDKTIELISNPAQLKIAKLDTDSESFLYTALKQFDVSKAECGTDDPQGGNGSGGGSKSPGGNGGSSSQKGAWLKLPSLNLISNAYARLTDIDDRVKDCSVLPGSMKKSKAGVTWNLVSRRRDNSTNRSYEVWKDSTTGLLWGDTLNSRYSSYNAIALAAAPCDVDSKAPNYSKNCKVVEEKACASDDGKKANANIKDKAFGLPTIQEFIQAEKNGVREIVPNMANRWFQSASLDSYDTGFVHVFSGNSGNGYSDDRDDNYSVRCVGRVIDRPNGATDDRHNGASERGGLSLETGQLTTRRV